MIVTGHSMPCRVELAYQDGEWHELAGVVLAEGESFREAVATEAKRRGASWVYIDGIRQPVEALVS